MLKPLTIAAIAAAIAAASPQAEAQVCPPGLAKKSPACAPPGQAKKRAAQGWDRGDVLRGDYVLVRERSRYGLPPLGPGEQYYRMGDTVLRVNDGTKQILDVIALAASALN